MNFSGSPSRGDLHGRSASDNLPGPGAYDSRDAYVAGHTSITYTIPKGETKPADDNYPGPGHYKIPVKFADVPRYVMPN